MKTKNNSFNRSVRYFFAPLLLVFTMMSCSDDTTSVNPPEETDLNIVEAAQEEGNFEILLSVAQDLGIAETLANKELTVFAPTDEAFNALPDGVLESLTDSQLETILLFHVLEGTTPANAIPEIGDFTSLQGERLLLQNEASGVLINGSSNVVTADVTASNGVVHAIDEVLLPSEIRVALDTPNIVDVAQSTDGFDTLLNAVESAGLTTTLQYLGPYTLFAPSDDAFAELPAGTIESLNTNQLIDILTYHVLDGSVESGNLNPEQTVTALNQSDLFITVENGEVSVNGNSNVFLADVSATNGVIHAVDNVLLPDEYNNVVENASKRYQFSTLVGALSDAGLFPALSDQDATLTVFAPTNSAFGNLPDGLIESLIPEQLGEVLAYHVFAEAAVQSGDLAAEQTIEALSGENIYVTANADGVTVNGRSGVVAADVISSNGVIHGIEEVLLPNAFVNVVEIAQKNYNLSTLVDLVAESDLVSALSDDSANFTVFAPTNDAFEAVSDDLSELTPAQVSDVLLYHVLPNRFLSGDLAASQEVTTLNEENVLIEVANNEVTVNGNSQVTLADQDGTNGVVHVVNSVLLPPSLRSEESSATITVENDGSQAWLIRSIDGEGASGDIDTQNATLTLNLNQRYTVVNLGSGGHPFQLRDSSGSILVEADGSGSLQNNDDANIVVEDGGGSISFTLTGALAEQVSTYNCRPHAAMEGSIVVN